MSAAEVKAPTSLPEPAVGDVLNQLDLVVKFTEHVRGHEALSFSDDYMNGYVQGLTSFRRYVRSQDFPHIVRITKETPTNAHRA